jgi:hypothetical protein
MSPGAKAVLAQVQEVEVLGAVAALTAQERSAIVEYSKEGYMAINNALWSGNPSADILTQVAILASALDKLPQVEGTLYRGIQGGVKEVSEILAASPEGAVMTWLGFTSTSTDRDFADYHRDHGGIMVHIEGGMGADISGVSDRPNESEVLLKQGSRFKVMKNLRLDDGTRMLILRQL